MFYDNFDKYCKIMGKSNTQVTKEIGLDPSSCSGWKKGAVPRNGTVQKLASYFGITVEELMGDEKKEPAGEGGLEGELDKKKKELLELLSDMEPDKINAVLTLLKAEAKK